MSNKAKYYAAMAYIMICIVVHASAQSSRIIGGYEATITQAPWAVQLHMKYPGSSPSFFCGGSIIAPNYIITAKHCVEEKRQDSIIVVAGSSYLYGNESTRQKINVSEIILHPDNNIDVALLKLSSDINLDGRTKKLIDYTNIPNYTDRDTFNVFGWGKQQNELYGIFENNRSLRGLQMGMVKLSDYSICVKGISYDEYRNVNMTGQGDSGSGLVIFANGKYFLIGTLYGREALTEEIQGLRVFFIVPISWVKGVINNEYHIVEVSSIVELYTEYKVYKGTQEKSGNWTTLHNGIQIIDDAVNKKSVRVSKLAELQGDAQIQVYVDGQTITKTITPEGPHGNIFIGKLINPKVGGIICMPLIYNYYRNNSVNKSVMPYKKQDGVNINISINNAAYQDFELKDVTRVYPYFHFLNDLERTNKDIYEFMHGRSKTCFYFFSEHIAKLLRPKHVNGRVIVTLDVTINGIKIYSVSDTIVFKDAGENKSYIEGVPEKTFSNEPVVSNVLVSSINGDIIELYENIKHPYNQYNEECIYKDSLKEYSIDARLSPDIDEADWSVSQTNIFEITTSTSEQNKIRLKIKDDAAIESEGTVGILTAVLNGKTLTKRIRYCPVYEIRKTMLKSESLLYDYYEISNLGKLYISPVHDYKWKVEQGDINIYNVYMREYKNIENNNTYEVSEGENQLPLSGNTNMPVVRVAAKNNSGDTGTISVRNVEGMLLASKKITGKKYDFSIKCTGLRCCIENKDNIEIGGPLNNVRAFWIEGNHGGNWKDNEQISFYSGWSQLCINLEGRNYIWAAFPHVLTAQFEVLSNFLEQENDVMPYELLSTVSTTISDSIVGNTSFLYADFHLLSGRVATWSVRPVDAFEIVDDNRVNNVRVKSLIPDMHGELIATINHDDGNVETLRTNIYSLSNIDIDVALAHNNITRMDTIKIPTLSVCKLLERDKLLVDDGNAIPDAANAPYKQWQQSLLRLYDFKWNRHENNLYLTWLDEQYPRVTMTYWLWDDVLAYSITPRAHWLYRNANDKDMFGVNLQRYSDDICDYCKLNQEYWRGSSFFFDIVEGEDIYDVLRADQNVHFYPNLGRDAILAENAQLRIGRGNEILLTLKPDVGGRWKVVTPHFITQQSQDVCKLLYKYMSRQCRDCRLKFAKGDTIAWNMDVSVLTMSLPLFNVSLRGLEGGDSLFAVMDKRVASRMLLQYRGSNGRYVITALNAGNITAELARALHYKFMFASNVCDHAMHVGSKVVLRQNALCGQEGFYERMIVARCLSADNYLYFSSVQSPYLVLRRGMSASGVFNVQQMHRHAISSDECAKLKRCVISN